MQYDKVRKVSSDEDNERIEKDILKNLVFYQGKPEEIPMRLEELDKERDIEKALESNASILALSGVLFGMFFSKKWLLLPAVVTGFLFQHSVQGWCPPLTVLRKMGYRTRKEIETEKHSLKLLQGAYDEINSGEENNPEETIQIVKGAAESITVKPHEREAIKTPAARRKRQES
jgi:hypothetical protein